MFKFISRNLKNRFSQLLIFFCLKCFKAFEMDDKRSAPFVYRKEIKD